MTVISIFIKYCQRMTGRTHRTDIINSIVSRSHSSAFILIIWSDMPFRYAYRVMMMVIRACSGYLCAFRIVALFEAEHADFPINAVCHTF
jgi:hypothetical protein